MKGTTGTILGGVFILGMLTCGSAMAGGKLDDATILAIFDQANQTDISTARLGVKYGHSKEVRELAKMVATDHEAVQQMGRDLAKKNGRHSEPTRQRHQRRSAGQGHRHPASEGRFCRDSSIILPRPRTPPGSLV